MRRGILTAALIGGAVVCACTSWCHAEGILDQQLGPAAPTAKDAPPSDAKKADPVPILPPGPAIDPTAAKALDDNDLTSKLTNSGAGDKNADDALTQMVDRMGQSQTRLSDKDVGAMTQETQRRILTDLDALIELARKQQQQQGKGKGDAQSKPGQKRQMSNNQQQPGNHQEGGSTAAQNSQLPGGTPGAAESNGESLRNKGPSEWGNLPPKDRDMISNGVNEQYLPAYRDMIDRYYQALAEVGKSKDK